ncbi:MAG: hypothetical protein ABR498_05125, partial [Candidatus Dormibacteria bacterium]
MRGAAGTVPPSSLVAAMNLVTGHYAVVAADATGAFQATLFAPGGTSILIKADPDKTQLRAPFEGSAVLGGELFGLGGTVYQVPDPVASPVSATLNNLSFFLTVPPWVATVRINKAAYAPGESIIVDGTYTFLGTASPGATPEIEIRLLLVGVSRADGSGTLDHNVYCSTISTPTGLPIERGTSWPNSVGISEPGFVLPLAAASGRLQTTFHISSTPLAVPDGYYRPQVLFITNGLATSQPQGPGVATRVDGAARRIDNYTYGLLPVIRIGNPAPPRLNWTLFANTMSQGSRGVTAVEDRDRYAMATRIAVGSDRFVIPGADKRSGQPIRYDLEPFALTVAVSNRGEAMNYPTIPFRFPSGGLTASIKSPSGKTTTIGPLPFRQPKLMWRPVPLGKHLDSNHASDAFQLSTLDDRFQVAFAEEGTHEITLSGTIEDVWGHVWSGRGTYVVDVGRTLEIDTALMPGTPLEAGDAINASMQIIPPVPADVEL